MKIFKILSFFLFFCFIFEIVNINRAEAAACTVTDGVYSETEIKNSCEATPDEYEIVIYKLFLYSLLNTDLTRIEKRTFSRMIRVWKSFGQLSHRLFWLSLLFTVFRHGQKWLVQHLTTLFAWNSIQNSLIGRPATLGTMMNLDLQTLT